MKAFDRHRAREADGSEQTSKMDRGHATGCDGVVKGVTPNNTHVRILLHDLFEC